MFKLANNVPSTTIIIQVNLNVRLLKSEDRLSIPERAYAAASGAVIAEEIPAANKPKPTNTLALLPKSGCKAGAISLAFTMSVCWPKKAVAAVEIIAKVMRPPSGIDT